MSGKKSPWIEEPPVDDLLLTRKQSAPFKPVLIHVWIPVVLRGQLHELSRELTLERGKNVSLSDVVRLGLRLVIKTHLKGAQ